MTTLRLPGMSRLSEVKRSLAGEGGGRGSLNLNIKPPRLPEFNWRKLKDIRLRDVVITFRRALIIALILHGVFLLIYAAKLRPEALDIPSPQWLHIKLGTAVDDKKGTGIVNSRKAVAPAIQRKAQIPVKKPRIHPMPPPPAPVKKETVLPTVPAVPASPSAPSPLSTAPQKAPAPLSQPEASPLPPRRDTAHAPAPVAAAEAPLAKKPVEAEKQDINKSATLGDKLGNESVIDRETERNYFTLLSLWFNKFNAYPEEARAKNMEGEGIIWIQIDRRGYVKNIRIVKSTGHDLLDHELIASVDRANPFPPMPDDFRPEQTVFSYEQLANFALSRETQKGYSPLEPAE